MKKALISAVILASTFSFSLITHKNQSYQEPHKFSATLTLTINDWQSVLQSISASDQLSAKAAANLNQAIVLQLQPQIAQANKEDSINQAKLKANQPKPVK